MNVLQMSTGDITGGAAKASYRLTKGLRSIGQHCDMLVKYKTTDDPVVHGIDDAWLLKDNNPAPSTYFQDNYINRQRTEISNTLFSLFYSGYDVTNLDLVRTTDVINLHWVVNFQSPRTIAHLASLGKPVVWTLHDQWPFTGGCHYSAGCAKYRTNCSPCPQLLDDSAGLISALLRDKVHYFGDAPITIVSPSQWLADCARESTLFRKHRVETIPNSLETDVFSPLEKETARKKLGLHEEGLILLFGSESGSEKRKGFKELLSAIQICMESERFAGMVRDRKITVMCFGHPAKELESSGLHVIPLGFLETDENIRNAYCAADIFILPSLEDNLPNTMLESMSCGIPVIAFNTGGMPDVIIDEHSGLIVPSGDIRALSHAIVSLSFDRQKRERMSKNCRKEAVAKYSLETQARRYLQLYDDLRQTTVVYNQCSRNGHETSGKHDVVIFDTTPGPNLKQIYNRILLKSLILSVKKRKLNGPEGIGVVHRIVRSVKDLLEAIVSTPGRDNRLASLLLRSMLKTVHFLKDIKRILKRSRIHG